MSHTFHSASGPSLRDDASGSRKRPATGQLDHEHVGKRGAGDAPIVLLRVVCPAEKSGPVIGKGGDVIRSIRDTTGARVKVDDAPRGANERAIIIHSADRPGEPTCAAQDALDKVIVRIFNPDGPEGSEPPEKVELALLLDRSYMGMIVGKGGEHVTRIRTESGASVQILARGKGSMLCGPDEDTVVIAGAYAGVRAAAKAVLDRVRDGVQRNQQPAPSTLAIAHTGRGVLPPGPGAAPMPDAMMHPPPQPNALMIHTVYRLLVPDARVGGIIGKGGDRLRDVREKTQADVKVDRAPDGGDGDRLVVSGSWETPENEYCAAAEGLMICAHRVVMDKAAVDSEGKAVLKLVAPVDQMRELLGPNGKLLKQVSLNTGAQMQVQPLDRPGSSGDETLVIHGHPDQVMEGTRIATMLLRGSMIRKQRAAAEAGKYSGPPAQYAQQPQQYAPAPAAYPAAQPYSFPPAPGTAPPPQYDPYAAPYAAAAPAYPTPDPYAPYYAALGQNLSTPQSTNTSQQPFSPYPGGFPNPSVSSGPPPQSGYTHSTLGGSVTTTFPGQSVGNGAAATAYNTYNPPAPGGAAAHGAGSGPAPADPPIGSLHNPAISSAGLAAGMVRYTLSVPTIHTGTLMGTRGANINAIRRASGARIKVHDSTPGAQEREVEISGQPAQVSLATSSIQMLVSTGKMPSNIQA